LTLLSKPLFAISTERTRYYLGGILLHDIKGGLAAVATDGHRLARIILLGASELSQDRHLIIPGPAVKILAKLLADKTIETVTLRRSRNLIEVVAASFTFVSKLIDATYPDYQRLMPTPSRNAATVDRAELARAIDRVAAVAPATKAAPIVGLAWTDGEPMLRVCVPGWPDLADDPIAAVTSGNGRAAIQVRYVSELVDQLGGTRICIDVGNDAGAPILVTDPDEPDFTVIQMPCAWHAEASQAA
jgi:DNA polymerase III subunit beta